MPVINLVLRDNKNGTVDFSFRGSPTLPLNYSDFSEAQKVAVDVIMWIQNHIDNLKIDKKEEREVLHDYLQQ